LRTAGHRGHGTGRTLENTWRAGGDSGTRVDRVRKLPDGTMTGGNQPTNIRGINRRRTVPVIRCLQAPRFRSQSP
jgi:hypothetical protein